MPKRFLNRITIIFPFAWQLLIISSRILPKHRMKKIGIVYILCLAGIVLKAQDRDLLRSLDSLPPVKEYASSAFKSSRVINGQSIELIGKNTLDVRILHRFGRVNQGIGQFFGLDQASMRMGLDYGLTNNLTIGIGRSTLQKELDGFVKFRPLRQSTGPGSSPVSVVLVAGMTANTIQTSLNKKTGDRLAYYYQAIVGRKFNSKFSFQASPTLVHRNNVAPNDENDIYALGLGGRYKFSKRMAFVIDYFYVTNGLPKKENYNPLSVGIDIETGGHVFQLHFSNASGMNERAFIAETTNDWGKGDIQFGFNLSRLFNFGQKKEGAKL
jgi:Membrane bound beta barrel domain (DUF5777)